MNKIHFLYSIPIRDTKFYSEFQSMVFDILRSTKEFQEVENSDSFLRFYFHITRNTQLNSYKE